MRVVAEEEHRPVFQPCYLPEMAGDAGSSIFGGNSGLRARLAPQSDPIFQPSVVVAERPEIAPVEGREEADRAVAITYGNMFASRTPTGQRNETQRLIAHHR